MSEYEDKVDSYLEAIGVSFTAKDVGSVYKWKGIPKRVASMVAFHRIDPEPLALITEFYSNDGDPSAYDVLSCLTKDEPPKDVWEFINEFGYEPSEETFDTYQAVCLEWKKVKAFFSESELEVLRDIAV